MRRIMKRAAAAVLMAVCLVSLSACTAKQGEDLAAVPGIGTEGTPIDDSMAQSLKFSAAQTLGVSTEQLIIQKALSEAQGDTESAALYGAQIEARHNMGNVKEIDLEDASAVLLKDGSYTVVIPVIFEEGPMEYVLNLNMATQEIQAEFTQPVNPDEKGKTVGDLLETACVYAAIGIGTVFVVLVFISLIISCFKYIHRWEMAKNGTKEMPALAPPPVPAPPVRAEAPVSGEDLSDDAELVAVITAAIAAYEGAGASSNGLVVRSIRRVQGFRRR